LLSGLVHHRHQRATGLIDWICSIAALRREPTNLRRDVFFCGRSGHDLLDRASRDRPAPISDCKDRVDQRTMDCRKTKGPRRTLEQHKRFVFETYLTCR
jgi:hypothetical protein